MLNQRHIERCSQPREIGLQRGTDKRHERGFIVERSAGQHPVGQRFLRRFVERAERRQRSLHPIGRLRTNVADDIGQIGAPLRRTLVRLRRQRRHSVLAACRHRSFRHSFRSTARKRRLLRARHLGHQLQVTRHRIAGGHACKARRTLAKDIGADGQHDARRLAHTIEAAIGDDRGCHNSSLKQKRQDCSCRLYRARAAAIRRCRPSCAGTTADDDAAPTRATHSRASSHGASRRPRKRRRRCAR